MYRYNACMNDTTSCNIPTHLMFQYRVVSTPRWHPDIGYKYDRPLRIPYVRPFTIYNVHTIIIECTRSDDNVHLANAIWTLMYAYTMNNEEPWTLTGSVCTNLGNWTSQLLACLWCVLCHGHFVCDISVTPG